MVYQIIDFTLYRTHAQGTSRTGSDLHLLCYIDAKRTLTKMFVSVSCCKECARSRIMFKADKIRIQTNIFSPAKIFLP